MTDKPWAEMDLKAVGLVDVVEDIEERDSSSSLRLRAHEMRRGIVSHRQATPTLVLALGQV